MTEDEAREKLRDHDMYISASDCDMCGPHISIECSCRKVDVDQGNADTIVEHVMSVLFPS